MASIQKHPSGWRAFVSKNGRRASKVLPTKREAQQWALEQEALSGRLKAGWRTFGDATVKYMAEVSIKKADPDWEGRRLETFVEFFGRETPIGSISKSSIAEWRDARLRTVSGSTVNREANLLRNVFSVACDEWEWIEASPFKGVKLPKENESRKSLWGWREIRRVLRADRDGKTKEMIDAFHIALRTGMRLQEVLAAPEGYDPGRRVVTVKTKTSGRSKDEIPVGRIAHKLLQRPAFTVSPNEGSVLFSKLTRQLLIEGLTFHDARATALTHLAKKVDVMTLAKISRHKDLSLLMNVYYRTKAEYIARLI